MSSNTDLKTITSVYLILMREGKAWLWRCFNPVGGERASRLAEHAADTGESLVQALCREAKEGASIDLDPGHVRLAHVMHRKAQEQDERLDFFFLAKDWSGQMQDMIELPTDRCRWFPPESVPAQNTTPYALCALENIQQGITYSEFGWGNKAYLI